MFGHYLKIAWRNVIKNKTFSLINVVGLSIGVAVCLLILQYVIFEFSFDRFNKNAENVYRVVNDRYQNGRLIQHGTISYSAIGQAMMNDFPEVINHCRVKPFSKSILGTETNKVNEVDVIAVDNMFFEMFDYALLAGNRQEALQQPRSMILSQNLATRIFKVSRNDFTSVIGKKIILNREEEPYFVTAVCKDVPENSHLQFEALVSYVTLYSGQNAWKKADYDFTISDFWHYVQLKNGTDQKEVEAKLPAFSERYFDGNMVSGSAEKFYLQPLLQAHLYSDFEYEIGITANAAVVWGLSIIAVLIIIIAWVNYINLTTARSLERAKEVGVRKISGATQGQLKVQFLTEALIINVAAFVVAILTVFLLQNRFNELVQLPLSLLYLSQKLLENPVFLLISAGLILGGIFVSGFYPAFVLSSFRPATVLKGKFKSTSKGRFLRKGLVTGQFAVTVALVIGTLIVNSQMRFVSKKDLGFNMSGVLIVKGPQMTGWDSTFITRQNAFMSQIKKLNTVEEAAFSQRLPGDELSRRFDVRRADQASADRITLRRNNVSRDFTELYEMKLLAGRPFLATDYNSEWYELHNIVINRMAAKQLGFSTAQAAIGKQIISGDKTWDIVGVIADFHQKSLRYPLEPTFFIPASNTRSPFSVKIKANNLSHTIDQLKQKYLDFFPGNVFDFYFLDQAFNSQYANERLFESVFTIFSAIAILIASLGLWGLSLFSTIQRTKEIGVRKVLGASFTSILVLLSKDFMRLILWAFIIAAPVSWFVMNNWLNNFSYRTDISPWLFVSSGLLAFLIAIGTTSYQALRAATANPVESLRYE